MAKFVDWIPTHADDIEAFFELADLSADDVVYDLGSGDGRLLFAALEQGAGRCVGIEIDPELVNTATQAARQKGVDDKVRFLHGDILDFDLSPATVVFCFLYPTAFEALGHKFQQELKPGTRIVTESFPVYEWHPQNIVKKPGRNFYLYTMPPEKLEEG